ncbi:MAG: HD domain-containing phosphohydrolase [Alphaproteobacteria bacterium]
MTGTQITPGRGRLLATVLLLGGVVAIALVLVFQFVEGERARERRGWQTRLGIVADSRVAAVARWVEAQYSELNGLAANPALQIYMTELAEARGDRKRVTDAAAQAAYLEILLTVTGARAGFAPPSTPTMAGIPSLPVVAGLALLDRDRNIVATTAAMPPLDGALAAFLEESVVVERALLDMDRGASGRPRLGFLVPVFAVQGANKPADRIGYVLGLKEADDTLFSLLAQPGSIERSLEAVLVRRRGAVIEFLSPLADGSAPLARSIAHDTPDLVEAYAIPNPGGFTLGRDYRDFEVLATSRAVPSTPWTLVQKIDRAEALANSDNRLRRMLVLLLVGVAAVAAGLIAAWRHGASRRAEDAMARFRDVAGRLERQGKFLNLVTDSAPSVIFVSDRAGKYRFANRRAAELAGMAPADMIGKTLSAVIGADRARRYELLSEQAWAAHETATAIDRVDLGGGVRVLQSSHVPLAESEEGPGGVLVVEEDVTDVVTERERRERTLRHLVQSLLSVVDRRDPYAANHSQRVGRLARAIADEMELPLAEREAAEYAGNLLNLGKILVSEDVLTRSGPLDEAERRQIRDSVQAGADFVADVEFDGPVAETIRQSGERWDGTGGPRGLAGDQILTTARVVAAANAFVAMVSARAHRPGLGVDAALATLFGEIGRAYDRPVVAALSNYLDNRGGRAAFDSARPPAP